MVRERREGVRDGRRVGRGWRGGLREEGRWEGGFEGSEGESEIGAYALGAFEFGSGER